MNDEFKKEIPKIVEELTKRAPDFKCPACGKGDFSFVGGYFAHDVQENLKTRQIGGVSIPTVAIICGNCGYISEFALGALGLLPKNAPESHSLDVPTNAPSAPVPPNNHGQA